MDISLREMRVLLAVSAHRNLSRAAAELRTAQSNVSRIVAGIESRLGHRLFERGAHGLDPTDQGAIVCDAARRVVNAYEAEMQSVEDRLGGAVGRVRLACVPSVSSVLIPKVLRLMRARFPGVEVSFTDANSSQVRQMIDDRRADIGVAGEARRQPALITVPYLDDRVVALVSRENALAERGEVSWVDFADSTAVLLPPGTSVRSIVDGAFLQSGVAPGARLIAPHIGLAAALVGEGLGITAVPALTLGLFDDPGVVRRPIVAPEVSRSLSYILRRDIAQSEPVSAAVQVLEALREERVPLPDGVAWVERASSTISE